MTSKRFIIQQNKYIYIVRINKLKSDFINLISLSQKKKSHIIKDFKQPLKKSYTRDRYLID